MLKIHPLDNVAVLLAPQDGIPAGHKVALCPIPKGAPVIKYGHPIGVATEEIPTHSHVHTHNLASVLTGVVASATTSPAGPSPTRLAPPSPTLVFQGYARPDGRAATRNEIWIIPTVGCVNRAAELIASRFAATPPPNFDGVHAFPHPFGCSQLGDDLQHTQKVLAGLINHPNAAAVLVLGLGCENNQLRELLNQAEHAHPGRIRYFNAQDVSDEIESGVAAVRDLVSYASQFRREPIPLSQLVVAMKCGGSDGFSGITANPLVGRVADRLCTQGATVLLSEVPEMFGAEPVLLDRAADPAVAQSFLDLVNDFRAYFRRHNQPIDENPSPGNKDGGITTLAEKSLGCVQKGGRAPVRQIVPYGGRATTALGGLALVNAPGNDGVSSTAMTVAGAHLILFTTGRGTPMGFPVPTLKVSTNSDLATRKPQWIDFDAGPIASASADPDHLADALTHYLLDVASGTRTRNEQHGYREIAIWKDGVTL